MRVVFGRANEKGLLRYRGDVSFVRSRTAILRVRVYQALFHRDGTNARLCSFYTWHFNNWSAFAQGGSSYYGGERAARLFSNQGRARDHDFLSSIISTYFGAFYRGNVCSNFLAFRNGATKECRIDRLSTYLLRLKDPYLKVSHEHGRSFRTFFLGSFRRNFGLQVRRQCVSSRKLINDDLTLTSIFARNLQIRKANPRWPRSANITRN